MDMLVIMKARASATILVILSLNDLAQADLYEFTANLSYEQNGTNHDLRLTMLGDGGLFEDPDNEGTEQFIFSGSGTLEYQFVPGLWFEIGNLSMGLSHWPFFSWPWAATPKRHPSPILPRVLSLAAWTASSLEPIFPKVGMDSPGGDWNALLRGTRTGTPAANRRGRLVDCIGAKSGGGARTDPRGIV